MLLASYVALLNAWINPSTIIDCTKISNCAASHSVKNSLVVVLSSIEAKQVPNVALVDIVDDKLLTTVNESVVQRHSSVNSEEQR